MIVMHQVKLSLFLRLQCVLMGEAYWRSQGWSDKADKSEIGHSSWQEVQTHTGSEREMTVKERPRNTLKEQIHICRFAGGFSFPLGSIFRSRQLLGESCKDPLLSCHLLSLVFISILERPFLSKQLAIFSLQSMWFASYNQKYLESKWLWWV